MPLSEHEQKMLDQIESALYAEDPSFASSVRRTARRGSARPRAVVLALAVVGLALLLGGLFVGPRPGGMPVLSLVGVVVMFAGGVLALQSPRRRGARPAQGKAHKRGAGRPGGRSAGAAGRRRGEGTQQSYTERMEDRFRRRFEG